MNANQGCEIVYGWPSIAAILGVSVRRARELATARGLISHRRSSDGAVGIARGDLEALSAGSSKPAASKVLATGDEVAPVAATNEATFASPASDEEANSMLVIDPDAGAASDELELRLAMLEGRVDHFAGRDEEREGTSAAIVGLAERMGQSEKRQHHQEQALTTVKRIANEDRHLVFALRAQLADLNAHVANLNALIRSLPMAMAPSGHKCGACGAKALASPVACGACGFGVGPGPTLG